MKYWLSLLCFILFITCKSHTYQLEDSSKLTLKESYFVEIPPAIIKGNTYVKAVLKFNKFDREKIKFLGFYFRNNFIVMKEVSDVYAIEGSVLKNKIQDENRIPFSLKSYEVVLSYLDNNKQRYAKFKIKRKVSFDDIPM